LRLFEDQQIDYCVFGKCLPSPLHRLVGHAERRQLKLEMKALDGTATTHYDHSKLQVVLKRNARIVLGFDDIIEFVLNNLNVRTRFLLLRGFFKGRLVDGVTD
jgi:hypothetical protein